MSPDAGMRRYETTLMGAFAGVGVVWFVLLLTVAVWAVRGAEAADEFSEWAVGEAS